MTREDILGAWALIGCTRYLEGGARDTPLGPKPTGLILYTPDFHMGAFIHKDPALAWDGPLLTSYAGRWEMAGDLIRHHVAYNAEPERAGQTLLRKARFEGATLVLQTERKQGRRGLSWMDFAWTRP